MERCRSCFSQNHRNTEIGGDLWWSPDQPNSKQDQLQQEAQDLDYLSLKAPIKACDKIQWMDERGHLRSRTWGHLWITKHAVNGLSWVIICSSVGIRDMVEVMEMFKDWCYWWHSGQVFHLSELQSFCYYQEPFYPRPLNFSVPTNDLTCSRHWQWLLCGCSLALSCYGWLVGWYYTKLFLKNIWKAQRS